MTSTVRRAASHWLVISASDPRSGCRLLFWGALEQQSASRTRWEGESVSDLGRGLDEVLGRPAVGDAERRALELFESVAATVPAYRAFLAEHGVDPAAVRDIGDFWALPLLTKDNYLRRYPLA